MKMLRGILPFLIYSMIPFVSFGQTEETEEEIIFPQTETNSYESEPSKIIFFEFGTSLTQPQGRFKTNVGDPNIFGLHCGFLKQFNPESPLFWGLHYDWTPYDSESAFIEEQIDFSFFEFEYRTYANIQNILAQVRFYPNTSWGKIEPYIDGHLGGRWLFSATSKTLSSDEESSDLNTESSKIALAYGVAAGANVQLSQNVYLNLRANITSGLSTQYLVKSNRQVNSSTAEVFDTFRSTTSIIQYHLGLTIPLNK
jgi:hypothetical protein